MTTTAQVQDALNKAGFGPLKVDNLFGRGTGRAVEAFQAAKGLTVDGKVGPQTLRALGLLDPSPVAQGQLVITADKILKVATGARADLVQAIVDGTNKILAAGITTPLVFSHFLAQICTETGGLKAIEENLNYSAKRLTEVWPKRFPTIKDATPYAKNPKALANKVYGSRLGNRPGTDDGWNYRGGGMMQTTGRDNYRAAGYEDNPQALREPDTALEAALTYWVDHRLTAIAQRDDVVALRKAVNGGTHGIDETRAYLAVAKRVFGA